MSGVEPMPEHDWMHSVYGSECKEEVPEGLPTPKGKIVRTVTFVDANLMHCKVTGKSATGVFHLVNQLRHIPRSRLQLRRPHMGLSLLQQGQQQNKSWI